MQTEMKRTDWAPEQKLHSHAACECNFYIFDDIAFKHARINCTPMERGNAIPGFWTNTRVGNFAVIAFLFGRGCQTWVNLHSRSGGVVKVTNCIPTLHGKHTEVCLPWSVGMQFATLTTPPQRERKLKHRLCDSWSDTLKFGQQQLHFWRPFYN